MKKLFERFIALSRGKQIGITVSLIHFMTLFTLICHHLISFTMRPPRPMVVKTIHIAPPAPKKVDVAVAKPAAPKVAAKPKTPPPPIAKKPNNEKALKEISNSLAALTEESKTPAKSTLNIPIKLPMKSPVIEEEDPTYGEYLIAYLQRVLNLPEYGEVRIELEIDPLGKLIQCQILESKSPKNATFLKEELAQLSYPIPHLSPKEHSKKFTVAFKNR